MLKSEKTALEKVKKAELITDEEYRSIKNLSYVKNEPKEKKDKKMDIDEKAHTFKYDDITKFNPKKKHMGLIGAGYKISENK
jgi:hypothetical protein